MLDNVILWLTTGLTLAGIGLAYYALPFRYRARPLCMMASVVFVGRPRGAAPPQIIKILYADQEVHRVIGSLITFWNAGNVTLRREDIADADPISFIFTEGRVLSAMITRASRLSTGCRIEVAADDYSRVKFQFDFLAPDDGVELVVLHTAPKMDPEVTGTVKSGREITIVSPDATRLRFTADKIKYRFYSIVVFLLIVAQPIDAISYVRDYLQQWLNSNLALALSGPLILIAIALIYFPVVWLYLRTPKTLLVSRWTPPPQMKALSNVVDVATTSSSPRTP